ncbi:MAG: GTPase HflX [Oligoflexia bacterium]|nr:GTPase HflX [Oligoflexia bacterium]
MIDLLPKKDKAIIVGIALKSNTLNFQNNLDELAQLCESAGGIVVGVTHQKLEKINPATYIGTGKVEELRQLKDQTGANLIIIDAKLSGIQQRNLNMQIGIPVIDRSQLIIDIFATRAQTREGKLQVELAQLKDQLPRLIGEAIAGLSKQAGGIGTRGPGETKLETDRRRVQERIEQVKKELEGVRKSRALHRHRRSQVRVSTIALVGYTNSGKSTLLNALTNAKVLSEDKLFATLDPTTRKLFLPSGRKVVLTDTVGFINQLPHHLVEAFKATFEEISEAQLILHIHDASHPQQKEHSEVVNNLLKEIGAENKAVLHVYNKIDLLTNQRSTNIHRLVPFVNVSAKTGQGLDELINAIENEFNKMTNLVDLYLPASDPSLVFKLSRDGNIISQEQGDHVNHVKVKLSEDALQRWSKYL